jgi:HK97 family phage prohead protease
MAQNKEQRTHLGGLEIRKNEDGTESRTIEGYGVVFESKSHQLGWFTETVSRTAFDEVNLDDVVATFNHDFNMVMARTSSKTLTLSIDKVGVKYRFDAPNTTAGNDLLENVRNGNVVGSSFMFTIKEDRWTFTKDAGGVDQREILKVDQLYELGPVTMPAYPDTTAQAKRTYDDAKKEFTKEDVEEANNTKKRLLELKFKVIKSKN